MSSILVTGATGTTGRHVVRGLLAAGCSVRAVTRRPAEAGLPPEVDVRYGDFAQPETLDAALHGVRRCYLLAHDGLADIARRAHAAGVEHAVLLSSHSVGHTEPDISTLLHRAAEQAVLDSGLAHTFLRPGAFMVNDLMWAPEIGTGTIGLPYPDAATAPIDERDIAAVAVAALLDPSTVDRTVELTGPRSLSQRDRVRILAEVTGIPVQIAELTPQQARERTFLPTEVIDLLLGVLAAAPATAPTTPAPTTLIGRDPHDYTDWAELHRDDFPAVARRIG